MRGQGLNVPQLLLVATSETPLLLVEYGFNVFSYKIKTCCLSYNAQLCWENTIHTEIDVVRNALSKPISVLSMWLTEYIPVCHLKTHCSAS